MSARAGQGDIVFSLSGQGCAMLQVSLPVNVCTCWSERYCILTIRTRLCYVTGRLLVYQSMSARAGQGDIVFSLSGQGCAMLQVGC